MGEEVCFRQVRPDSCGQDEDGGAEIAMTMIIQPGRAVTGRRCPQSGKGEDFLSRQQDFFTETAVTPERKVENSFPMWEIKRHAEG